MKWSKVSAYLCLIFLRCNWGTSALQRFILLLLLFITCFLKWIGDAKEIFYLHWGDCVCWILARVRSLKNLVHWAPMLSQRTTLSIPFHFFIKIDNLCTMETWGCDHMTRHCRTDVVRAWSPIVASVWTGLGTIGPNWTRLVQQSRADPSLQYSFKSEDEQIE